jgi:2-C-methyl-D-erythritol 2,4-cyclodiphosphate synthase
MYRVGIGYDIHPLAGDGEERPLVLGGAIFPGERGLAGHSDADVIVHAVCDALLGALALGDLGRHFPDTSPAWKGVSSIRLLERVVDLVMKKGWRAANVDATLIAERPKIAPMVDEMRTAIAKAIGSNAGAVSIKATRPEGIGVLGASGGMACLAIATVTRSYPPSSGGR